MPISADLPADVLAYIFSFLPNEKDLDRARAVCRAWNKIASHELCHSRDSLWFPLLSEVTALRADDLKRQLRGASFGVLSMRDLVFILRPFHFLAPTRVSPFPGLSGCPIHPVRHSTFSLGNVLRAAFTVLFRSSALDVMFGAHIVRYPYRPSHLPEQFLKLVSRTYYGLITACLLLSLSLFTHAHLSRSAIQPLYTSISLALAAAPLGASLTLFSWFPPTVELILVPTALILTAMAYFHQYFITSIVFQCASIILSAIAGVGLAIWRNRDNPKLRDSLTVLLAGVGLAFWPIALPVGAYVLMIWLLDTIPLRLRPVRRSQNAPPPSRWHSFIHT